ncbi:MAG: hypothetical protein HY286_14130 [Planctomycetes bacterium]|nr:hypothetical protein [Planctomycetota bacterium]
MPADNDSLANAITDIRRSVDALREDLRAKDAEIRRLQELLNDRDARIRGLGEQALHLLDLLHEARAKDTKNKGDA